MARMNFYDYFTGLDVLTTQTSQIEGEFYINELFDRILKKVIVKASENEILRKIPGMTATTSLDLIILPLV